MKVEPLIPDVAPAPLAAPPGAAPFADVLDALYAG